MNPDPRSRLAIVFLIWLGLIFATSSTVIKPQEFFALIQYYTGAEPSSIERFKVFWGVSWFAIVKGWHFTEFAILTGLCVAAIRSWLGTIDARSIFAAMAFCILFAITDEWHQTFVADRFGTIMDVIIDSCGVVAAGVVMLKRNH